MLAMLFEQVLAKQLNELARLAQANRQKGDVKQAQIYEEYISSIKAEFLPEDLAQVCDAALVVRSFINDEEREIEKVNSAVETLQDFLGDKEVFQLFELNSPPVKSKALENKRSQLNKPPKPKRLGRPISPKGRNDSGSNSSLFSASTLKSSRDTVYYQVEAKGKTHMLRSELHRMQSERASLILNLIQY